MNLPQLKTSDVSLSPHFLLIGNPVGHSLSPIMHNTAAVYYNLPHRYYAIHLFPSELSSFAAYLNNEELKGVNVTIPYKQQMLGYVDELDSECQAVGALNTMVKVGYRLKGFNTDVYGFCEPLRRFRDDVMGSRAIIFGTGGAARAIALGLSKMEVEETMLVSRSPQNFDAHSWPENVRVASYDAWPEYADAATLFVNATPLGMEPNTTASPVNDTQVDLLNEKICYDIVYNPRKTAFLKQAREAHARTIGGLEMLIHQGSRAFELWTGNQFPIDVIREKLNQHLSNDT